MTPVWPTMSGLAKLMIAKRKSSSCHALTKAAVASPALISGLRSYVGTSRGDGASSRRSPSSARSLPPPKKYVTCGYFSVSATCSWRPPCAAMTRGSVTVGRIGEKMTG